MGDQHPRKSEWALDWSLGRFSMVKIFFWRNTQGNPSGPLTDLLADARWSKYLPDAILCLEQYPLHEFVGTCIFFLAGRMVNSEENVLFAFLPSLGHWTWIFCKEVKSCQNLSVCFQESMCLSLEF